jgi:hypothetical protein
MYLYVGGDDEEVERAKPKKETTAYISHSAREKNGRNEMGEYSNILKNHKQSCYNIYINI